jgi:hypothetical protein
LKTFKRFFKELKRRFLIDFLGIMGGFFEHSTDPIKMVGPYYFLELE